MNALHMSMVAFEKSLNSRTLVYGAGKGLVVLAA